MLKIKYYNYTYIDPNAEDSGVYDYTDKSPKAQAIIRKYEYNQQKVDEYNRQRRFSDGVSYGRKYHFNDSNLVSNNYYKTHSKEVDKITTKDSSKN